MLAPAFAACAPHDFLIRAATRRSLKKPRALKVNIVVLGPVLNPPLLVMHVLVRGRARVIVTAFLAGKINIVNREVFVCVL